MNNRGFLQASLLLAVLLIVGAIADRTGLSEPVTTAVADIAGDVLATGKSAVSAGKLQVASRFANTVPLDANETEIAARKMSESLRKLAQHGGDKPVSIVVSYARDPALYDEARIKALGGEIIRSDRSLKMHAVRVPASALGHVAISAAVTRLSLDSQT